MTRDEMFEAAFAIVEHLMLKDGRMNPFFLTATESGKRRFYGVDGMFMQSDQTKDMLVAMVRQQFAEAGVCLYAYASEIWMHREPARPGETKEQLIARARAEAERRGYSPQEGCGRDEAVSIVVGDHAGTVGREWRIVRREGRSKVKALEPGETEAVARSGRFADLVRKEMH